MRTPLLLVFLLLSTAVVQAQSQSERLAVLLGAGSCTEAYALADSVTGLSAQTYSELAACASDQDDYQRQVFYLKKALELEPENVDFLYLTGEALGFTEDYEAALPYIQKAIEQQPGNAYLLATEGHLRIGLEQYEQARDCYAKAVLLPNCPEEVFGYLAQLYEEEDRPADAVATLQLGVTAMEAGSPAWSQNAYQLGQMQYLSGNAAAALEVWQKLFAYHSNDYELMTCLIQAYYALGEYDKALPFQHRIVEAYQLGQLPNDLAASYCFDQFLWNDSRVFVREYYLDSYPKYRFIVSDEATGNIIQTVQLESVSGQYQLTSTQKGVDCVYPELIYPDLPDYPTLKKAVISVLEGKATAIPKTK